MSYFFNINKKIENGNIYIKMNQKLKLILADPSFAGLQILILYFKPITEILLYALTNCEGECCVTSRRMHEIV